MFRIYMKKIIKLGGTLGKKIFKYMERHTMFLDGKIQNCKDNNSPQINL